MEIELTNDMVYVLCALSGGERVAGIANPFEAMDDDSIREKLNQIITELQDKNIIHKTEEHNYEISNDYKKITDLILNSKTTYIFADDNDESDDEYVFVKNDKFLLMKNENLTNLKFCFSESKDEFKSWFRNRFDFIKVHNDSIQYMLSLSSPVFDKAIEEVQSGGYEEAIRLLDGDEFEKDEMLTMLKTVVAPQKAKTLIEYTKSDKISDETIYRVFNGPSGSWVLKISTVDEAKNTLVFKIPFDDITKILFMS